MLYNAIQCYTLLLVPLVFWPLVGCSQIYVFATTTLYVARKAQLEKFSINVIEYWQTT